MGSEQPIVLVVRMTNGNGGIGLASGVRRVSCGTLHGVSVAFSAN